MVVLPLIEKNERVWLLVNTACFFITFCISQALSQPGVIRAPREGNEKPESVLTIFDYLDQNVAKLAPPKYIEQRRKRNEFHRKAYTGILFDECGNDGFTALLGWIKLDLSINYSLASLYRLFWVGGYPLPDYYGFPIDPWKKEWWSTQ